MMPTMAEVKKPPGIVPGTRSSPRYAQAAATIRNKINVKMVIVIVLFPHEISFAGLPTRV